MSVILIIDDNKAIREQFSYDLKRLLNAKILTAENGKQGLETIAEEPPDAVVLDLEMPIMDGMAMLEALSKTEYSDIPVVVCTGVGNFQRCVKAVQLGACDFFDKSDISIEQMAHVIEKAIAHRKLNTKTLALYKSAIEQDSPIIGVSQAVRLLRENIARVARVPSNVFIQGESGTGKELVARELHRLSPRMKRPFIAINCAAIPENLVESELFGFEKGAFSGAIKTTKGKFEIADGGTLFLDEIGDMPLFAQAKLLRILQEGELSRIGGEGRIIRINVRVLTATHRDIEKLIENEQFRRDLYYRLCAHTLQAPPLRDRPDDVPILAHFFLKRLCKRFEMKKKQFNPETVQILCSYNWQENNVRELENVVERMLVSVTGDEILPEHIPEKIRRETPLSILTTGKTYQELKEQSEKEILLRALQANDWRITQTAKKLGIANHSNLLKMMRRLGIKKPK